VANEGDIAYVLTWAILAQLSETGREFFCQGRLLLDSSWQHYIIRAVERGMGGAMKYWLGFFLVMTVSQTALAAKENQKLSDVLILSPEDRIDIAVDKAVTRLPADVQVIAAKVRKNLANIFDDDLTELNYRPDPCSSDAGDQAPTPTNSYQGARPATPSNGVTQLTGKERRGEKWKDEQRIDNCKVPLDKRGTKQRPDSCAH
jgi:hypothetical protein